MKKSKIWFYINTSLRWYLAFYMFNYGFSKITEAQFGINTDILNKPLNTISTFHISWYLFGLEEPFKYVVGVLQIVGSILIIIEPLAIFGALFLLPIILQIFIIDISYVKMLALSVRVFIMLLCDLFILYYYKDKIYYYAKLLVLNKNERDFKIKYWHYIIFLIVGFLLDFVFSIFSMPIKLLIEYLN